MATARLDRVAAIADRGDLDAERALVANLVLAELVAIALVTAVVTELATVAIRCRRWWRTWWLPSSSRSRARPGAVVADLVGRRAGGVGDNLDAERAGWASTGLQRGIGGARASHAR